MIVLKTKDYCGACPAFEPEAKKYYGSGQAVMTEIRCVHRERCDVIREYLEKQIFDDDLK